MREWLNRLRDWIRRDRLDAELTEEMAFHRGQLEREAQSSGGDPDTARHAASRALGSELRAREAARERWSWPWLDHLLQDLRYAVRGLRRNPAFAATVIVTLGLGIGANAAMFGVIDRLMFRPLPFLRDPERVHRVYLEYTLRNRAYLNSSGYEFTTYLDLVRFSSSFEAHAAFADPMLAVGVGQAAREMRIGVVTASFFDFFAARPALGRWFTAAESATPVGAPVVVLSHALWQTDFGGRDDVVGQTLHIGNIPCTIIGVAPDDFSGVPDRGPSAAYIPLTTYAGFMGGPDDRVTYYTKYHWGWTSMMVRRKPGVSEEQASRDLSQAYVKSWDAERLIDPEGTPTAVARPSAVAGSVKPAAGPDPGLEARTLLWVSGVAVIVRPTDRIASASLKISANAADTVARRRIACR